MHLVESGLGYAITLDKLIDTRNTGNLCFRPLTPRLESRLNIVWKKYQVFFPAAKLFLERMPVGEDYHFSNGINGVGTEYVPICFSNHVTSCHEPFLNPAFRKIPILRKPVFSCSFSLAGLGVVTHP